MKTTVKAARNGGAGKTALARNRVVPASQHGRGVLCLDLNPRGALRAWWEGRDADGPATHDRNPAPDVGTRNAAQAQFNLFAIDIPPAEPEWLAEAPGAADLVVIPVRPSPDDLRARNRLTSRKPGQRGRLSPSNRRQGGAEIALEAALAE